ncbi:hypothetical protein ACV33W_16770 [Pseudomonas aeruginosa]
MTEKEKAGLITALSELVLERLLLQGSIQSMHEYRERNQTAGQIIGRMIAAVTHEGELGERYLALTRECELKAIATTTEAQDIARKSLFRVIKRGGDC